MAYSDFQAYLNVLEQRGLLTRVTRAVDKDWEIAAVCRVHFQDIPTNERSALMFTNIKGFETPLVAGALGGSPYIYAAALESTVDQVLDRWSRGIKSPLAPERVRDGLCHENVLLGEACDLQRFPHPIWTVGRDPGPYITSPYIISKDPETGVRNVGTYRLQVKGPRRMGMMTTGRKGIDVHVRKNAAAGKDTEVAIVIGADPVVGLVSVTTFPENHDELAIAGGIRQEPLPVVRCRTVDLEVPATAEIVIEGHVISGVREAEGPFGEYTGYMSEHGDNYVVEVSAITFRNNPVYQVFVSQMPPSESSCIRSLGWSMTIFKHLRDVLGLPVTDVFLSEWSGSSTHLAIAMKKTHEGQPVQAMHGAWSILPASGKFTVVVDSDIDIRDPGAVEWAQAWHVQPDRDVYIQRGTIPVGLDPSQPKQGFGTPARAISSKIGIDATRKGPYPPPSVPPKEHLQRVRSVWNEYGIRPIKRGS